MWASNGRCVEKKLNNFKVTIREGIQIIIPHKILRKTPTLNTTL
jgi:hypothetical protein